MGADTTWPSEGLQCTVTQGGRGTRASPSRACAVFSGSVPTALAARTSPSFPSSSFASLLGNPAPFAIIFSLIITTLTGPQDSSLGPVFLPLLVSGSEAGQPFGVP